MKKAELCKIIIHQYGVYPPEKSSYEDLIRLHSMLVKHGKFKRGYLQSKGDYATDAPVYNPPPYQEFYVEEETVNAIKPNTHTLCSNKLTNETEVFYKNLQQLTDINTQSELTFAEINVSESYWNN